MATLQVQISTGMSADSLKQQFQRSVSSKYADVQAISDKLFVGTLAGRNVEPELVVSVLENATKASGTFILTSVIATDVVTINGVSFTAVASGATGNQFNVGVNDLATATNLAAAINASVTALVAGYVTAAVTTAIATPATVTVTSAFPGTAGNQTLIASADATIVASGARLTGGIVDPSQKTYSF